MWYQSKFFWLNLIALVLLIVNYFLSNDIFPNFNVWWGLIVVVLNAIAGMIQATQVARLKAKLKANKIPF